MSMNLEELRRKRVKLFDRKANDSDHTPASSQAAQEDTTDDERYARDLQASLERGEDPFNQISDFPTAGPFLDTLDIEGDAKLARELQAEYDYEFNETNVTSQPPFAPQPPLTPPNSKRPSTTHTTSSIASEIDISSDAVAVRNLAAIFIKSGKCGICGCLYKLEREKLVVAFNITLPKLAGGSIDFLLKCSACGGKTCFGCGTAITASSIAYGNTTSNGAHLTWHCDGGRLALVWYVKLLLQKLIVS